MRTQIDIINEKIATLRVAKTWEEERFICSKFRLSFGFMFSSLMSIGTLKKLKLIDSLFINNGYVYINNYGTPEFRKNDDYYIQDFPNLYRNWKNEIIDTAINLLKEEKELIKSENQTNE